MGYRSEVAIVLWKPDYKEMIKKAPQDIKEQIKNCFTIGEFETPDETYVCMYHDWIKWFPEVDAGQEYIKNFLDSHRHSFVRLGEDTDDTETDNIAHDSRGSDEEFYELIYPHRSISGLEDFGINTEGGMTKDRAMELLEQIVQYVSIGNNTSEQVEELLKYGFTPEELVRDFGYSKADVDTIEEA